MELSKTVYSLVYPDTEKELLVLWRHEPIDLYQKAYKGVQNETHIKFLDGWKNWIKDIVKLPKLTHSYATHGSSEAIRESLANYASRFPRGTIHVFEGEYEGYAALAEGYNLSVVKHKRDKEHWGSLLKIKNEPFYLSQPSSIDGCFWENFDDFIKYLETKNPSVKLRLDLCYVGSTIVEKFVNCDYEIVDMVFFSLSKIFGVYYHRIGGVFSKEAIPGLFGNVWFKNVFSLKFGTDLMNRFKPSELPKKYAHLQSQAVEEANRYLSGSFISSDVFLLAYNINPQNKEVEFTRDGGIARLCLTPRLDELIRGEFNEKFNIIK